MKPEFTLEAGARLVSSEMQDFFDSVYFLIPNWKWFAIVGVFIAVYFFHHLLKGFLKKLKTDQNYFKDKSFMQFLLKIEIEKSISWILTAILGSVLIESLELTLNLEKYFLIFFKLILAFNIIRVAFLSVEAFGEVMRAWTQKHKPGIDDQLVYMVSKTLKVLVIIIGILVVLQNFGVNVTALLAGLGLGGVALAFAAQDTVANVFGTITILLDTPFRIGDHVKMNDIEGIVEEIGFRSTRIRTFYNSIIVMPNSIVSKEKIDNMSQRNGWIRFRHNIGLTYDATPDAIQHYLETLRAQLLKDPTVDPSRISINFSGFGDSSLNIAVIFHYRLNPNDSEALRNERYLDLIHRLTDHMRLEFAFPTRTMIVENKQVEQIPSR